VANERLEAALAYANRGWAVLPVVPGEKLPATQHGVHDATTDEEQILRWWGANPDFNIGVAAGERSGIIVYDVDPRNGGEDSWELWCEKNGRPPDGCVQMTAGGGMHYIARYTRELRSCKLLDGVDLLSDGRYFLAAPSVVGGRQYFWDGDQAEPFLTPVEWVDAYHGRVSTRAGTLAGEIIKGRRNDGLAAIGGGLRSMGLTEKEIVTTLLEVNSGRCDDPLPESEVRQIARSVARYEPDTDVGVSVALGAAAADDLLRLDSGGDYYMTKASAFLSQPAPLQWAIKGWVPAGGLTMLYGESGVGKTFITLDMACSIACGMEWMGSKVRPGVVVYLCGEGNYGLRLRIAAWARDRGRTDLDNLIVSNRSIDIGAMTAGTIIEAIREVTDKPVSLVVVDTLNNHMAGDENSARDTRMLVNACKMVIDALGCAVCLNHHIGHGGEARGRARGSSAWKASLDSSILVSRSSGDVLTISSTKMKDARPPDDLHGVLEQVELPWRNEDGEPETSAVLKATTQQPKPKKEKKVDEHMRHWQNAWFRSGCERTQDGPYLSRSAFRAYCEDSLGHGPSTSAKWCKPGRNDTPIGGLLMAEIITAKDNGWVVICAEFASQLLLMASEKA
jgi:hypothetical protein